MANKPKKRRRRTLAKPSLDLWQKEVDAVYASVLAMPALKFENLAEHARTLLPHFKELQLDTASFFHSKWWGVALQSIRDISGVDEVNTIIGGICTSVLRPYAEDIYRLAYFWELVFSMADPSKIRERPRPGEHPFQFMSLVTSRYQVIYRTLAAVFPDEDHDGLRHAMCRYFISDLFTNPQDAQEETLSATLLTELWMTGNNEFYIGPELREMFMQTDVGNLAPPALPYQAFHVQTDHEQLMFTVADHVPVNVRVWVMWSQERGSVQLQQKLDQEDTLGDMWDRLPEEFWAANPAAEQACREAFLLICNLCLYLETQDAEVRVERTATGTPPAAEDRRELRRYAKKQLTPTRRVLYPSLADTEKVASGGDGRHTRRHWVRGHYRMQAYWPHGRDEAKINTRIWIKPHLRGHKDDDAPRSHTPRTYKVDK